MTAALSPASSSKDKTEVSVCIAVSSDDLRGQLANALGKLASAVTELECGNTDLDALVTFVERLQPAVLFLGMPGLGTDAATAIARLSRIETPPAIVAVSDTAEPSTILKAIRAGAAEFVYAPFEAEFEDAAQRVFVAAERPREGHRAAGKMVGFVSVKGGCGATTVSCHAASWLGKVTKKEVLLADLDTSSGISSLLMQTETRYTVDDALQSLHRLDLKLWKAMVATSSSGADVIAASAEARAGLANSRRLPPLFRFWRNQYDYTLIDFGHGVTPTLLETLDSLDTLVLITTNELPSLRKAKEFIQLLAARDFGANRLKLVVNRMPKRVAIALPELEKLLGFSIFAAIPNNYQLLNEAYSQLQLIDLESDLGRHFSELAGKLAGIHAPEKKHRKLFAFR